MFKRWAWWLGRYLLYLLVLGCRKTYRFTYFFAAKHHQLSTHAPHIAAVWHQNIIASTLCSRSKSYTMLASTSQDGDTISFVLERLGHQMVRGSSRHGGITAYRQLIKAAENGACTAITVDGPIGPRHEVKMGVLRLAQKTGQPIFPVTAVAKRFIRFNSWDHFRFPLPFSPILVYFGDPIFIPRDSTQEGLEEKRKQLQTALLAQEATVEDMW